MRSRLALVLHVAAALSGGAALAAPAPAADAFVKGMAAVRAEDCDAAIPLLEEAMRSKARSAGYLQLGNCYRKRKEFAKARASYQEAMSAATDKAQKERYATLLEATLGEEQVAAREAAKVAEQKAAEQRAAGEKAAEQKAAAQKAADQRAAEQQAVASAPTLPAAPPDGVGGGAKPPPEPRATRWGWWVAGGAAVVAAAVVGVVVASGGSAKSVPEPVSHITP